MLNDIKEYSLEELKKLLESQGFPYFSAIQLFSWIYKKRVEDFSLMTDLSRKMREFLKDNFYFSQLRLIKVQTSSDGTVKFLLKLSDASLIESVLIPEGRRYTLCLSTQVGCKFGCRFCLSGKDGFRRNLTVSEIINQYLLIADWISPRRITNLVFMGIGEPLDNFDNVVKAVGIFLNPKGIYMGRARICISTCGLIPQIVKLLNLNLGIKLSISLHSPFDKTRSYLMPVNKKYPLGELIKILRRFFFRKRYPLTFEYVLIKGVNTTRKDALNLARCLGGLNYKLNLIPYNTYNWKDSSGKVKFMPPSQEEMNIFKNELKKRGVFFTLRKSRGGDIQAACGQLSYYKSELSR